MYGLGPMRSLPGHARLSGNASRDDHNVGTGECLFQTVIGREISSHFSWSGNVRYIGRYARSVDDIEQPQLWRIGWYVYLGCDRETIKPGTNEPPSPMGSA